MLYILLQMSVAHTVFPTRARRKYLTLTTQDFLIGTTHVYIPEKRRATILTGHVFLFSGVERSSY